jgi:hypothetical protein
MKLTIPAGDLDHALGLAALPLGDARVRKISSLGAIWLGVRGISHLVAASDVLDLAIDVGIDGAEIEEAGELAVPGERLAKLIAAVPPDCTVTITSSDSHATIAAGRSRYRLPILPLDQLPAPMVLGEMAAEIELDCDIALRAFSQPLFAVATDSARYYLSGVFLQTIDTDLITVAADGHRLCRVKMPAPSGLLSDNRRLVVPLAACKLIVKILRITKPDSVVTLRRAATLFELRADDVSVEPEQARKYRIAVDIGLAKLRAMLESAHEIDPNDDSEEAQRVREFDSVRIFDGLEFTARVGIKAGENGFADRNVVQYIITPDSKEWSQGTAPKPPLRDDLSDEIPFN